MCHENDTVSDLQKADIDIEGHTESDQYVANEHEGNRGHSIIKGRYKNGSLEILLADPHKTSSNFWLSFVAHPKTCRNVTNSIMSGHIKIKVTGVPEKGICPGI